ncbi:serine protease inhibitor [Lentinula raphanica]|uniref:Serine protease inhibitor n=1 Tax=Lentinula raphanica TaxID=153919 RepID=A0AA38P2U7_9AGAR|nr:serine protease inhibitor [Lentinula raphanica]KAJ3835254.1 serine protease inhibitor [Lentinula raphanica]KAJ3968697.1 serine protease inhibitor [Lentinula raphanica]
MSLETGHYLIHNGGKFVSRSFTEDRTLSPKNVDLLEPSDRESTWIIEKTDDGYILNNRGAPTTHIDDHIFALLINQGSATKWNIEAVPQHGEGKYIITSEGKGWVAPDNVNEQIGYSALVVEGSSDKPTYQKKAVFEIIKLE